MLASKILAPPPGKQALLILVVNCASLTFGIEAGEITDMDFRPRFPSTVFKLFGSEVALELGVSRKEVDFPAVLRLEVFPLAAVSRSLAAATTARVLETIML